MPTPPDVQLLQMPHRYDSYFTTTEYLKILWPIADTISWAIMLFWSSSFSQIQLILQPLLTQNSWTARARPGLATGRARILNIFRKCYFLLVPGRKGQRMSNPSVQAPISSSVLWAGLGYSSFHLVFKMFIVVLAHQRQVTKKQHVTAAHIKQMFLERLGVA